MISLIIGNKGTGKTKRLIDLVNAAVEASKGDVVCVERGQMLTYDVNHKARLIDTNTYGINGYDSFYGFLSGICACNYDVTDIFIDATLKIGGKDYDNFADFIEKVSVLSEESNTRFTLTVSCDESELADRVFEYAIKI
jgi:hypothetical protein